MKLTGKQHRQLREAIQSAFVNIEDLEIMLREKMDLSLNNIVSGKNYNQIASNLINQLEAQNRIVDFIEAALEYVPNQQELLNCQQQFMQKSVPSNQELLNCQQQFVQKSELEQLPTPPINFSKTWFQVLRIVTINSSIITLICIIIRFLGILQPYELWAFDRLIQLRGSLRPHEPDDRILVVEVTSNDLEEWDEKERTHGASLPDEAILKLLQKLDQYNPKAIGLDIYRPFKATESKLAEKLRDDSRLFAVCKVPAENSDKEAPPPEVPKNRLGFSDLIQDPDGVLRRYLFHMDFEPTLDEEQRLGIEGEKFCQTNYAISFQLVLSYLGEKPQLTKQDFYKIRNVVFKPLDYYTGGYQGNIDALGHQVLLDYRNFRGFEGNSPKNVAERLTLNQVIQDGVTTEDIEEKYQDRIILIGRTTEGEEDYWSTPLGGPEVPGVFIHAQIVSQILRAVEDGRPLLWYWPQWVEVLWVWVWATVGGIIVWYNRQPKYIPVMVIVGIISVVNIGSCIFVFLVFNGWLPLIPPIIALIFTALIIFYKQNLTVKSNNLLVNRK